MSSFSGVFLQVGAKNMSTGSYTLSNVGNLSVSCVKGRGNKVSFTVTFDIDGADYQDSLMDISDIRAKCDTGSKTFWAFKDATVTTIGNTTDGLTILATPNATSIDLKMSMTVSAGKVNGSAGF